jgi:PAS domain S-box-containing protein
MPGRSRPQPFVAKRTKPLENALFLDHVTAAVPCLIYVYDVVGRRDLYVNSHLSALLGYTQESLAELGLGLMDLLHPDDVGEVVGVIGRLDAAEPGTPVIIECRMQHASGEWRWVRSRSMTFERDAEGHTSTVIGAAVDVTERKIAEDRIGELETRLHHASKLAVVGTTLASIAHELHQPLAAIANYASGCARVLSTAGPAMRLSPAEVVDKIRKISDEAIRAGNIIRRLQTFLRMHEPVREQIDVHSVIDDAVALSEPLLRSHEIEVGKDYAADVPGIEADGAQLTQVVLNLLLNAADACAEVMPERRNVSIQTRLSESHEVEIAVTDRAGSIPPHLAERIFDQFFTTRPSGLGMGLAICRSIVESHGGRIEAQVQPGRSSTVRFTLPTAVG